MKLSEAITKLHANTDTYLFGIDIKDISTSEFADLASAIQQNTSASFLSFSDRNLNAEAAQVITEALRQNTTVQEIVGIELSDISELLVRNRYFAAKKQLEDICYANDHLGQTCRKLYPESAHAFRETGLRIIAHIERLKADDPTKIAIFTKALNKLSDLVQYQESIVNIDEFLVDLKTNINSDDYNQLRARIFELVELCIIQEILGIELSHISELRVRNRVRNRYFAAKKQLEDICYANDHLGQTCRKLYPEYAHSFRETGLRIIAHIERLKADDPTKIAIFTKALNKLSDLVQYKENIVNIDEFLVDLKTNIDSDDYKQLRARICVLVGLCIMFASIVAITFSVITGSALLIPAAAIGLSCVAPMLGAAAMIIDEAGINKAGANGQLKHYFFTSTTPEREDDRQVLDILEPFASPT